MEQSNSFIHFNSRGTSPDRSGNLVARVASSIIILVSCLVLIGWQLDLWWLKSWMPGAATMKANTAVCLLLAGISLQLRASQRKNALMARIARGCAIAIIPIASLTICQYIFWWQLGIDELLFRDLGAVATSHPGRMGINTAIGLSFIGAALCPIERQRQSPDRPQHQVKIDSTTIAQILTVVAGLIALQAIVGYAYNVRVFYHLSAVTTSMALHTAFSLGILSVGILALTSEGGFMRALTTDLIGGKVARRFMPQAISIPLLIGWLILQGLEANLYDPNFALSLMSMSMVVIWLGLIRKNAGTLNRMDYDRQHIQAKVKQQLGEIEAIYRSAPIGLSFISSDLQFIRINQQLAQINGLSVSAHIGRTIREVLPAMADTIEPIYQQVIESGEPILDLEMSGSTAAQPDLNRYWLASYHPHIDAQARVRAVSAVVQEITDRKQQEVERERQAAALRESEQRFRTLADNMSQFAWMADASGWIFWYNRRWFEYTGTTLEQMQGWGWQQVHHPDYLNEVVAHFRQQIEIGQEWEDTFPLRDRDGSYRWFLSRAIPIVDETGQVLRWFGTNTDITDLKQAQADLQARHRELDSFAQIVSQDLKAPLRAIDNLSKWIEEDLAGVLTVDTKAQMSLLRSRVDRMRISIDGLLDYSRIDRTESTTEAVVVSELLSEVIDSLAPPPTFSIKIDPNLPTIDTNRVLLFQVFTNLIGNGIKHHDRLDGSIQISGREYGDLYEFIIADDGPGIAPEYQANIFTIFQTGNPRTADSTGVGLAIVKKIVKSQGGTIRLESQVGMGTTFYFTWANVKSSY